MASSLKTFKVGYTKNVGYKQHGSRTVQARDADEAKVRVRHLVDGACNLYIQSPQV
jgi:hypothetical protein